MRRALLLLLAGLTLPGCASSGVRELAHAERDALQRIHARLDSNRVHVRGALSDLEDLAVEAVEARHRLEMDVAKSRLLAAVDASGAANRRPEGGARPPAGVLPKPGRAPPIRQEVALYRLFALAEAERALLEARLDERRAAVDRVRAAYDRLIALTARALELETLLLAHLEGPAPARLSDAATGILAETRSFGRELETSDHAHLRALGERTERAADRVRSLRERIAELLDLSSSRPDPTDREESS